MFITPGQEVQVIETTVIHWHYMINHHWYAFLRHVPKSQRLAYQHLRWAINRLYGIYTGTCKGKRCL